MNISDLDPFANACTIAQACSQVWRKNHMPENSVAIIPPEGYPNQKKYSIKAVRWIQGMARKNHIKIRHALNGGEQKVCGHYVDGFDPETKTVYEFHGCYWHGCPKHFPDRTKINTYSCLTMYELFKQTVEKTEKIEKSWISSDRNVGMRVRQTVSRRSRLQENGGCRIYQLGPIDFNTRNKVLTAKLLRQGYRYHKLRKAFSKFYRRHFDIVSKYNVGLKTLLLQGLSEPEFYGDLVYKFRKIIGKIDFPYHFKKIIVRYKKIGYNINVMRQTACLVVNPIKVNSFAYLFNCTMVGRTSD